MVSDSGDTEDSSLLESASGRPVEPSLLGGSCTPTPNLVRSPLPLVVFDPAAYEFSCHSDFIGRLTSGTLSCHISVDWLSVENLNKTVHFCPCNVTFY